MRRARPARSRDRFDRVYFIGAGFSAGMHYPVGSSLMPHVLAYLQGDSKSLNHADDFENSVRADDRGAERADQIVRVIERVLRTYFATKLSGIDRVDVAEFFTLAQALSERTWLAGHPASGRGSREIVAAGPSELTLFADLAAATRSYFMDISDAYAYPEDIKAVLGLVRPSRDAVINFNWDEEVDIRFSWDTKEKEDDVSYTLGAWRTEREDGHHRLILKPHGSVGWYDLRQGIGNKNAYLIAGADDRIARYDKRVVAYMDNERPLELDGETYHSALACPPVITAPTFGKRFEYPEQHRIWQDVLEVCEHARDFVFLGYSLPRDDFLTRAAIRAAMSHNRSSRRLRCLVVDRSFEDSKLLNFLSVFDGQSRERNYLQRQFGSENADLGDEVTEHLARAFVGRR
jgi:hypothetical protein